MSDYRELFLTKLEEKKTIIDAYKIKAASVFDMNELYESMSRWFEHKGYEWKELRYKRTDNPNGSVTTEIGWECTKKIDDYVKFVVTMGAQIVLTDVEVNLPNNAKKKMNKGSIESKFTAYLQKDVGIWEKKALGHLLGLIYEKILIRKRLEEYEKAMFAEINTFFDEVRLYLQIR